MRVITRSRKSGITNLSFPFSVYGGTSVTRKHPPPGPYRRPMPRVLGGSLGVGVSSWARYPVGISTSTTFQGHETMRILPVQVRGLGVEHVTSRGK